MYIPQGPTTCLPYNMPISQTYRSLPFLHSQIQSFTESSLPFFLPSFLHTLPSQALSKAAIKERGTFYVAFSGGSLPKVFLPPSVLPPN